MCVCVFKCLRKRACVLNKNTGAREYHGDFMGHNRNEERENFGILPGKETVSRQNKVSGKENRARITLLASPNAMPSNNECVLSGGCTC
jgi:hypothetical protein